MTNLFQILILSSLVLLVIGFISPKTSLFWYKKERTRVKSAAIYSIAVIVSFILFGISTDTKSVSTTSEDSTKAETTAVHKLTQAQQDSIAKAERLAAFEERKNQTISAKSLTKQYIDNEVRADENFKGEKFYVEGIVSDIKKDILDDIYVTLEGAEMFREVQCYFSDKETASKLEKNMRVTFYGECNGLMMNVLMKDCKLTKNLSDMQK